MSRLFCPNQIVDRHIIRRKPVTLGQRVVGHAHHFLHVDPSTVIQACADLCQPGGDLFFSTINRNPKSFLFAIVGAEYILNLLPRGTHEYDKLIKPSELARWIREAGLDMQEMMGMTYNPLTKRYRLTPNDVSVNYLIRAKKP